MSKLPPLPEPPNFKYWVGAYDNKAMKKYGQQCRDAAIEDVADAMMKSDLSGLTKDHYLLSYTAQLMLSWATYIRTLKNEQTTITSNA